MIELLIVVSGLFVLLLLVFTSHFSIEYLTPQSEILDLGNYTRAYRCKECNSVYSGSQTICGTCGCENGMVREIGKWHRRISKLRVEYWWEPKITK